MTKKLKKVKLDVYCLVSILEGCSPDIPFNPLIIGPVHSRALSTPRGAYKPSGSHIGAQGLFKHIIKLCPHRYPFKHLGRVEQREVNFLLKEINNGPGGIRTHDLSVPKPASYHWTTVPHFMYRELTV